MNDLFADVAERELEAAVVARLARSGSLDVFIDIALAQRG